MLEYLKANLVSFIAIAISFISLLTSFYSNKLSNKQLLLNKFQHKKANSILKYISTEQTDNKHFIKLALYNPDAQPIFIEALSIYKLRETKNPIFRLIRKYSWVKIDTYKWWPNYYEDFNERVLSDEYKSLYVENIRDIQVEFDGYYDRNEYVFKVDTNKGWVTLRTTIDAICVYFCKSFSVIE